MHEPRMRAFPGTQSVVGRPAIRGRHRLAACSGRGTQDFIQKQTAIEPLCDTCIAISLYGYIYIYIHRHVIFRFALSILYYVHSEFLFRVFLKGLSARIRKLCSRGQELDVNWDWKGLLTIDYR